MFEKYNEMIADIKAESNRVKDPENYYNIGKHTYSYRGKKYEYKPIYDGFIPQINEMVTIDGFLKPREKLTVQQIRFYLINDFARLLRQYDNERGLYKLIQAILFIAVLYGSFKIIF